MRFLQTEYLLKGVYLGLVLYAALQQAATPNHPWDALARVNLLALGGLLLALLLAGLAKLREGYRVRGRLLMQLRDGDREVGPGELIIVPHGVEHCPKTLTDEVDMVLLERKGTLNTGNVRNERTVTEPGRL